MTPWPSFHTHRSTRSARQRLLVYALGQGLVAAGLLSGCHDPQGAHPTPDGGQSTLHWSSVAEIKQTSDFFFRALDSSFSRHFDTLHQTHASGSVTPQRVPARGYWYPNVSGGTAAGGALARYDRAFHGGEDRAARWERENHQVSPAAPEASWSGHCNGMSAAAVRHIEPKQSVTEGGQTFTPEQIKALLAEIYMGAGSMFLGGNRCDTQGQPPTLDDRGNDVTRAGPCEDVNAGTFHAALLNWVGAKRHSIILDQAAGDEVWNFPIRSYRSTVVARTKDHSLASTWIASALPTYAPNPGAAEFVRVRTEIVYTQALQSEGLEVPCDSSCNQTLEYVVELDGEGHIQGGEWLGASRLEHPDFLWISYDPLEGRGTRAYANPHVDPKVVLSLWAKSVGFDPAAIPPEHKNISEPALEDRWGKYQDFSILLDGYNRGSTFLSKSSTLGVIRNSAPLRSEGVRLEVRHNGRMVFEGAIPPGDDPVITLEPRPWTNFLGIRWVDRAGAELQSQTLRYFAAP